MATRITGTGGHLPRRVMTNRELETIVDTDDEWIVAHTGITQRHIAAEDEYASDLAVPACEQAMDAAGIGPDDIDLIIVATTTEDMVFPATACLLQEKLGVTRGAAFDVQAVCTGFIYALAIADKFVASGQHQRALVVGAETFSRILDWSDRRTCILFGDGAGAVVVEASDEPGILSTHLRADGRMNRILCAPGGVSGGEIYGDPFMQMDGKTVFNVAVNALQDATHEALAQNDLDVDDIDWLVPHQANARILEAASDGLGMDRARLVSTVATHGNTSAASVPLALATAARDGRLEKGNHVMLLGVGGGMTWGSALVRW